jgi:site-specific recombinase XerD
LSNATIVNYGWAARGLWAVCSERGCTDCSSLLPSDLTAFVQQQARRMPPERARLLVTGLRSFLGYLRHRGDISSDLSASIPAVANWALSTVPKSLPAGAAQEVIGHCHPTSPIEKRNYAILLLLARLGLRAGEIVALNLEDIDWEAGKMTIRGKGGRYAQLPLLADIGKAVASYLHGGRPPCNSRSIFVRHVAPIRGFGSSAMISTIVSRALTAAKVTSARKGAHVFRHALASDLLRHGVSLEEIGELLRHRSPNTTAIYAKVDTVALRELAMPWPGGVQ